MMKNKKLMLKVFFSVLSVFLALTCIISSFESKKVKAESYYTDYINSIGQFHITVYGEQYGTWFYLGDQNNIMDYQHTNNGLLYQNNTENYIDGQTLVYLNDSLGTGDDSAKFLICMEYYGWYSPDNQTWTARDFNINKVSFSCVFDNVANEYPNGYNLTTYNSIKLFTIGNNSIDNVNNVTNNTLRTNINIVNQLHNNYLFYAANTDYNTKLGNFITGYNYTTNGTNYNNYTPNICIEIPTQQALDYACSFQYLSWNMANDTNWSGLVDYYKNRSYGEGYNKGYEEGKDQGFIDGATASDSEWLARYNRDIQQARDNGYQEGIESVNSEWGAYSSVMTTTFNGFRSILNIEIFPNITIAMIIGLPILLGAFLIILKLIRG